MPPDPSASGIITYDEHDKKVMTVINDEITRENAAAGTTRPTVAEKLERLRSHLETMRSTGDSTDTVLRDAEYYFVFRMEIARDKTLYVKIVHEIGGLGATALYNGLKAGINGADWVTGHKFGLDTIMRTDKHKPNAPPGGFVWGHRGACDAMGDDGESLGPVSLHKPDPATITYGGDFPTDILPGP
jgi:hypothetical protein